MSLIRSQWKLRRAALRIAAALLIPATWSLGAQAQSSADTQADPTSEAPAKSKDSNLEQIKYSALDLQAEVQEKLDRADFPRDARISIYVAASSVKQRPRWLSVSVDGGVPVQANIDDGAVAALVESEGLLRIARFHVTDGAHQLHVEMDYAVPTPGLPTDRHLALDQQFEKMPGAVNLEFSGQAGSALSSARIETVILQARSAKFGSLLRAISEIKSPIREASFLRGSQDDPQMRYAAYLSQLGAQDQALRELMVLGKEIADDKSLPENYWLRTAAASRQAGLLDHAQSICDRLAAAGASRQAIAIERLHLGEAEFESGDLSHAAGLLIASRSLLPEDHQQDWRFAEAQLLFAQNRRDEAVRVLNQTNNDSIEAIRYLTDPVNSLRSAAYARFNLAIALIQNDQAEKGLSWIDLVGRLNSKDKILLALRDRANLTLGWYFLKARQGRTALGVFGRVGSQGLAADEALLGIGWSQLAPAGHRLPRTRLPDQSNAQSDPFNELPAAIKNSLTQLHVLEPELRGGAEPRSFASDDPPADRIEGLQRAIRLWKVLAERDTNEQSVEEGLLAIAYAYDQLDDRTQARDAYQKAITAITATRDKLVENQAAVRQGALSNAIAHADSVDARFLAMYRFGLAPEESADTLFAVLDRYENFESLLGGLRQLDARLADALAADTPATADAAAPDTSTTTDAAAAVDTAPPADDGTKTVAVLRTQIDALERSLQSQQIIDAEQIKTLAAQRLTKREVVIERYLDAAYLSAARIEDRSFKAEPPSP